MAENESGEPPVAGDSDLPASPAPAAAKPVRGKPFAAGNKAGAKGRPKTDARLRAALAGWSLEAARTLRGLMRDPKTPRETKRKIAEYLLDRRLGRPSQAVTGQDGSPLFPSAAPADSPISRLIERVRERQQAAAASAKAETATPTEIAPPGEAGSAPRAVS